MHLRLGTMRWFVLILTFAPAVRAADAVTDAKRHAADQLIKEGKTADAIALLKEVIKVESENFKDHLSLARAYDKLNQPTQAVAAYRRVAELLGPNDDRQVRNEVERRLKILDAQIIKIQGAEEEFLKKLDALEREAIAAKDARSVERIWKLKGGVWLAQGRKEQAVCDVLAAAEWQTGGLTVIKGRSYRIRAVGEWEITPGGLHCTADGVNYRPSGGPGAYGSLIARVETGGETILVGTNTSFIASATGRLIFISAMPTRAEREKNSGYLTVMIQRE